MTTQHTRFSGKSDFIVPPYKLPSGLGRLPVGSHMFGVKSLCKSAAPPSPHRAPRRLSPLCVCLLDSLFLCLSVAPGLKLSTCDAGYPLPSLRRIRIETRLTGVLFGCGAGDLYRTRSKLERFGVGFMYLRGVYTSPRRLRTRAVAMPSKRNKRDEAPLPLVK